MNEPTKPRDDWCNCQAVPGSANFPGPWHPVGNSGGWCARAEEADEDLPTVINRMQAQLDRIRDSSHVTLPKKYVRMLLDSLPDGAR
jgi:hypothetical protein